MSTSVDPARGGDAGWPRHRPPTVGPARAARAAAATVGVSLAERLRQGSGPASILAAHAASRLLPVPAPLAPLFPSGGLRRGSAVAVEGSTALLTALLAPASAAGSWCAVVGLPGFGVLAAAEAGLAPERLALVPDPGVDLVGVLAALVDGVDLVVVGTRDALSPVEVRRLAARARQRGTVLLGVGSWPGAELRLSVGPGVWQGLGDGHGHLRARRVTVRAEGRGGAVRGRGVEVWLPAVGGGVAATEVGTGTVGAPGTGGAPGTVGASGTGGAPGIIGAPGSRDTLVAAGADRAGAVAEAV